MKKKQAKGYALVAVLIVIAVFSILTVSLLSTSLAEAKYANIQDKNTKAHYIARSGVQIGEAVLNNRMQNYSFTTFAELVNYLNSTYVPTIPISSFAVGSEGIFTLSYEAMSEGIKIKAIGRTNGSNPSTATVTKLVNIINGVTYSVNPDDWVNGLNLVKGIHTSYVGSGVKLQGHPIQSPMNDPHNPETVFQASIIRFTDYPGPHNSHTSFRQLPNSIAIVFDAEIMYFESALELNGSASDSIKLRLSDTVINYRMTHNGVLPIANIHAGFESHARYSAFIGSNTPDLFSSYPFIASSHYGIVILAAGVSGFPSLAPGYYFFRSEANLKNPAAGDFILIDPSDAIIKALNEAFKPHVDTTDFIWNDR